MFEWRLEARLGLPGSAAGPAHDRPKFMLRQTETIWSVTFSA
jgi:hypothetical protein